MSSLPIEDAAGATRKVDVFQRTDGADLVDIQAVAIIDPANGNPLRPTAEGKMPVTDPQSLPLPAGAATQATLAALLVAADAIKAAAEALNGKTTAVNTGAIGGTVALDVPTLLALESITASTGGLTDAQLRASPVAFSATGLPLPAGAATETTLAALLAKVIAGPATEAKQDAIIAKLIAGPATETTVAAILAKLIASPATEATLATLATAVGNHDAVAADGRAGLVMLAKRRDTDATAMVADGDLGFISIDENGRVKVSSQPATYLDITGDITAVQATIGTPVAGGTVSGDVSRASNVMAFCSGTFNTVNVTFEGSLEPTGETNWFGVQAVRTNANTIETATGNLSAQPVYAWELSVNALARLRVRCTARTSGTQSWRFKLGTYATEPIPAAQISGTQPVSGSLTATLAASAVRAGFVAGAGIWYDDSATVLAASATFTGTSRDATVTATAAAFANAATYAKEVRACAESDQAGTLWLEVSRDNTNWRRAKSAPTAAVTGGGQYAELVHRPSVRYWRVGFTNGATLQTRFMINSLAVAL